MLPGEMAHKKAPQAVSKQLAGAIIMVLFCVRLSTLYDALSHHCLCNLDEACHVGTLHIVDVAVGLCAVLHAVLVNVLHDELQTVVNLLCCP